MGTPNKAVSYGGRRKLLLFMDILMQHKLLNNSIQKLNLYYIEYAVIHSKPLLHFSKIASQCSYLLWIKH